MTASQLSVQGPVPADMATHRPLSGAALQAGLQLQTAAHPSSNTMQQPKREVDGTGSGQQSADSSAAEEAHLRLYDLRIEGKFSEPGGCWLSCAPSCAAATNMCKASMTWFWNTTMSG